MINERQLLVPYRVRFTQDEDIKEYGDNWFVYDETALVRLPVATLMAYEQEMDRPLTAVLQGMRDGSVMGHLGAAWLAVRMAGGTVPWGMFTPAIMLAKWEKVPEGGRGKAPSPAPTPGDTVALDVSPAAE